MMKLTQKEIERYRPYHTYYEFHCGFNQSSSNMPNITKEIAPSANSDSTSTSSGANAPTAAASSIAGN